LWNGSYISDMLGRYLIYLPIREQATRFCGRTA
jgi:hypothetical protein